MRAESIEQIREHLARGGMVLCHWNNQNASFRKAADIVFSAGLNEIIVDSWSRMTLKFDSIYVDHWELVPIEPPTTNAVERDLVEGMRDFVRDLKEPGLPSIDAKTLPSMTEDPTGGRFRDSQKERMQRIRQPLLFGHYPAMNDLIEWWQATTGERIEWGRRCNTCECSGSYSEWQPPNRFVDVPCDECNGDGYTVRPTWMDDQCQPQ